VGELWTHPQLQARGRLRPVASPGGELQALLPPGRHDSFDYRMDPIPAVGAQTEAILRELGRGEAEIARLRAAGAI
jgi:formyl-CoA transferase